MTTHTCLPGHAGVLADDCPRCREHAEAPMLLDLDDERTEALWDKMLAVKFYSPARHYETGAEAAAGHTLYLLGVWIERHLGVRPWVPLAELRARVAS